MRFPRTPFAYLALFWTLSFGISTSKAFGATTHASSKNCISVYSSLSTQTLNAALPENAAIEEVHEAYDRLNSSRGLSDVPRVDAQRLINSEDWEKAVLDNPDKPWLKYGRSTILDWLRGLRFIKKNAGNLEISSQLLRSLHVIVAKNLRFHGFEGRRIRQLYDQGIITKMQFQDQLRQVYKENKSLSGVDHRELAGRFRFSKIDEIVHNGSSLDAQGGRYFSEQELNAIRANPYMRVDESTVKKIGDDAYQAHSNYLPVKDVDQAVEKVLAETTVKLKKAASTEMQVRAVIEMQKNLISIHPFLDGNGRTIRLMGDLVYQRLGLPPPLRPNESDLVMSLDQAYDYTRRGMIDYVNERGSYSAAKKSAE
ncbi:MAG: Fic family protein [Bdellovibrionota bacterium]